LSLGGKSRKGRSRNGENLDVWCVYNKVALSQSLRQIATGVQDVFGLACNKTLVASAVQTAAKRYRSTYFDLIEKLRNSAVIHGDETWVPLTASARQRGYIWAFADMGDVRRLVEVRVTVERLMSDFNGRFVCCQERAFRQLP
jgi:hypothetical protein